MNKTRYIIPILAVLSLLVSCKEEVDDAPTLRQSEAELTLEPGKWIYYRISDNTMVGRSTIGDAEEDKEWADRLDWDIAFSEGGIRTNGGASGRGNGGITVISNGDFNLDSYDKSASLFYYPDVKDVQVIAPLSNN